MAYPSTPRANDAPIVDVLSYFFATWKLPVVPHKAVAEVSKIGNL